VPSGRHRAALSTEPRRRQGRGRLVLWIAVGAVALAGGVAWAVGAVGGSCSSREPVLVNVAAAVDVAPAAMESAGRFNQSRTGVQGRCVLVQVTEQPPATVLRTLIRDRAGVLRDRPDGWISDSSAWVRLARKQGAGALADNETVVATSPLVFATRRSLSQRFAAGKTEMDWEMVFPATTRGRLNPTKNEPDVVRVPDPSLSGAGIATVAAARDVVGTGAEADKALTAFVRWAQAASAPDYRSMLEAIDNRSFWQRPVVIVPEQSVWTHNRESSADPVVALHPREGTINLDYPYVVTAEDEVKASGSRAFAEWLRGAETQDIVRLAGFRSADGSRPPYSVGTDIPTQSPRTRPTISPNVIDESLEAWSRLAPPTNILVLADSSRHMAEPIRGAAGKSTWDVALDAARTGLQLFPSSTSMGLWESADKVGGGKPYRERMSMGPLTQPDQGQVIRRSRLEELMRTMRPHASRPSALYSAIDAGFREVTEAYDESMNNVLLVLTAGRDDGSGISRQELVDRLRKEWNPEQPVQIIVVAFGRNVDQAGLAQITAVTNGSLHVAQQPGEIIDVFLGALARRLCHPTCPTT
jgi:hypothetical protein